MANLEKANAACLGSSSICPVCAAHRARAPRAGGVSLVSRKKATSGMSGPRTASWCRQAKAGWWSLRVASLPFTYKALMLRLGGVCSDLDYVVQCHTISMDSLYRSCELFEQYPQNLVHHDSLSHNLKGFSDRLLSQERHLFEASQAAIDVLDFDGGDQANVRSNCVTTLEELVKLLREALVPGKSDPQCRFIFLHAPQSRAPLRVSREMLLFLFSYYQVMPSMLDFIFPFGKQIYARDFHFSGFREESRLDGKRLGIQITELERSGKELRLCYNLRSVEPSHSDPELPWSIRQLAMYHSFDLESGQSLWINVKGNRLFKDRITDTTVAPFSKSRSEAFSASLTTHLLLCDWSGENWRWYINDLENQLQDICGDALAIQIDKPPSPVASPAPPGMGPRSPTWDKTPLSRSATLPSPRSWGTKWNGSSPTIQPRTPTWESGSRVPVAVRRNSSLSKHRETTSRTAGSRTLHKRLVSFYIRIRSASLRKFWQPNTAEQSANELRSLPPTVEGKKMPPELPPSFAEDSDDQPPDDFTFSDLQRVQYIEDKTQEVLLVLRLNSGVLEEMREHYRYATNHIEFPSRLRSDCEVDLARFDKCLVGVEKDLLMLQSRTETLLRLLANRKNLLNGILQYRGVKANEAFARRAQVSAARMEMMTEAMHDIAKKTEQETVSMRVITSVTLFFLPATFIATFMSTDILNFENGKQDLQKQGLVLYLAIAIPATALTFLAWFMFYQRVTNKGFPFRRRTVRYEIESKDI
ncbi:hypothetical protein K458DRAFT_333138 [Lentithecium fluviatile CBS 122367]|uniref:CorA-like transporter domain-containing protein n=1 Tax=Lentithecium fluviatile CBS 122367 TaxID=1168545 RepID=A0A6G1JA87_9PLEO|nr:hypothetical protein K458DRAFT_333138 [Lentithecium fluviatile CBS 122367]